MFRTVRQLKSQIKAQRAPQRSQAIGKPKKHNASNVLGFLNFNENQQIPSEELPTFNKVTNVDYNSVVGRLLPSSQIPPMPDQPGITWQPPNYEKTKSLPYNIKRGRFHTIEESIVEDEIELLPYDVLQVWRYPEEPLVRITKILNVTGSFESLESEVEECLNKYFEEMKDEENFVACQINELDGTLYVKGHWRDQLIPYFVGKGF